MSSKTFEQQQMSPGCHRVSVLTNSPINSNIRMSHPTTDNIPSYLSPAQCLMWTSTEKPRPLHTWGLENVLRNTLCWCCDTVSCYQWLSEPGPSLSGSLFVRSQVPGCDNMLVVLVVWRCQAYQGVLSLGVQHSLGHVNINYDRKFVNNTDFTQ